MIQLSFGPLHDLCAVLEGAGVRASADPATVTPPGAWVTVENINQLTVDGQLQLECVVYLIVGDTDHRRAYDKLAELYNLAATVLVPDGPVVPQGVILADTPTPLPALRVPVNLI